jgi:hypothetical protein
VKPIRYYTIEYNTVPFTSTHDVCRAIAQYVYSCGRKGRIYSLASFAKTATLSP